MLSGTMQQQRDDRGLFRRVLFRLKTRQEFDCRYCDGQRVSMSEVCQGCGSYTWNARRLEKPKVKPRCPNCLSRDNYKVNQPNGITRFVCLSCKGEFEKDNEPE